MRDIGDIYVTARPDDLRFSESDAALWEHIAEYEKGNTGILAGTILGGVVLMLGWQELLAYVLLGVVGAPHSAQGVGGRDQLIHLTVRYPDGWERRLGVDPLISVEDHLLTLEQKAYDMGAEVEVRDAALPSLGTRRFLLGLFGGMRTFTQLDTEQQDA